VYRRSSIEQVGSSETISDFESSSSAGFGLDGMSEDDLHLSRLSLSPILSNATFGIDDHDYVFWLGDFNYRIQTEHRIEEVFSRVERSDLAWLRKNDQLLVEQAAGRVFVGFKEAEIQFLPTYKFQTGTNHYDRRPDKKTRAPAYCDRILWRDSVNESHARILKYVSCPTLCMSDHKPVIAVFEARVREKLPEKRSSVFHSIIRQLDNWENAEQPKAVLDRNAVAFSTGLAYMESRSERITLTNVGRVPVAWRFAPKMEDRSISKSWLRVEPDYGLLTPSASVEIVLTAKVDGFTARRVAAGVDTLDDILVLRLEHGRDHFVCVSATMLPTCFGMDLARLVRTHSPAAASRDEQEALRLDRVSHLGEAKAAQPLKLPKELWWLCNYLWVYDQLKVPYIFTQSHKLASPALIATVRRCLDHGHELVPDDDGGGGMAHAVAVVLLEFLNALPEPVVPFALFPRGWTSIVSQWTPGADASWTSYHRSRTMCLFMSSRSCVR